MNHLKRLAVVALMLSLGCVAINTCHIEAMRNWQALEGIRCWKKVLNYSVKPGNQHVVVLYSTPDGSVWVKDGASGSRFLGPKSIQDWTPLQIAQLYDFRVVSAFWEIGF